MEALNDSQMELNIIVHVIIFITEADSDTPDTDNKDKAIIEGTGTVIHGLANF